MIINLDNNSAHLPFTYEIVRSPRRRSISIEVRAACVRVRAPLGVAERDLHQFVREKRRWISCKIAEQKQLLQAIPERHYQSGAQLPYLGHSLKLVVETVNSPKVERSTVNGSEYLHVQISARSKMPVATQVQRLVHIWYQQEALRLLTQKTDQLVTRMALRHAGVTVKATRSKWGHCTSRGAIQYNWHILLAPMNIVDYLVAHEVCHLRHPNHSPAFWQLVASVCPSFLEDRAWLKAYGAHLVL
jgi:predicted metal-dependent hydrolase